VTYQRAVERVAGICGIMIDDLTAEASDQAAALFAVCEFTASVYEEVLWSPVGATALAYLMQERGMTEAQIRQARLGWADGSLRDRAATAGLSVDVLRLADLVVEGERGRRDRFWSRIMVPIQNHAGQVCAFQGRLLPADEARYKAEGKSVGKYVNSTETPIYRKGGIVYNLHRARGAARQAKQVIVVEGALDVLACVQAGYPATVAALGTAFTADHAKALAALKAPVVLCLDGDRAGRESCLRAVEHLVAEGASMRIASLEAKDPAQLLAEQGDTKGFEECLKAAVPGGEWWLRALVPSPEAVDDIQKLSVLDQVLAKVATAPDDVYRSLMAKRAAKYLGIDAKILGMRQKSQARAGQRSLEGQTFDLSDYGNAHRHHRPILPGPRRLRKYLR